METVDDLLTEDAVRESIAATPKRERATPEQVKAHVTEFGTPPADGRDLAGMVEDAERELKDNCFQVLADAGVNFVDAVDFMADTPPPWEWIVPDFIARGMKGDLYGKSKTMKTFLALQLAHCLAGGRKFMCWDIPRSVNVVYFNLELMERGAWERMKAQQGKLGVTLERGRLHVCNLRSNPRALRDEDNLHLLVDALKLMKADIVIVDPRYKLEQADEDTNTAAGMRGILDFRDNLLEAGCAVLLVGHDPKGDTAGKAITDRGAGSYTAGADYDFCLTLSPHKQEGYTVLSASSRYRQSPPDMSLLWQPRAQVFEWVEGVPAEVPLPKGGRNPNNTKVFTLDGRRDLARKAAEIVRGHEFVCTKTDLVQEVYTSLHEQDGVTQKTAAAVVETMLGRTADAKDLPDELGIIAYKREFPRGEFIGTPEQVEAFKVRESERAARGRLNH